MHDKAYVLKMLEDIKAGKYTKLLVLYDIFCGAADLTEDPEIKTKIEEALIYLVEEDIISALRGEEIVHRCLPMMLTEEQKKRLADTSKNIDVRKPATCHNSPIGPFYDIYGTEHPVVIDFGRMDIDWIRRVGKASPKELSEMIYGAEDKNPASKGKD